MKMVVCKACRATLLVSAERLPVCGRCGGQVEEAKQEIARVQSARQRATMKWIAVLAVCAAAGGALLAFRDAAIERLLSLVELLRPVQKSLKQEHLLPLIVLAIVAVSIVWILYRVTRRRRSGNAKPAEPPGSKLKEKVERLAGKAWGSRQDIVSSQLVLRPEHLSRLISPQEFVAALLKHVGSIAPNLSVPIMTPRIVSERLCDAAGQFHERDGWVTISVDPHFFDNQAAAYAILCHELCHYVLEANGIREPSTLENERLTDVAMFVFGLGDIFLLGYSRKASSQYRPGHRLGYLSDAEYQFADRHVAWLRSAEEFLKDARRRRDDWNWDRSLR